MGRNKCYRDCEASPCDRVIASLPCGCAGSNRRGRGEGGRGEAEVSRTGTEYIGGNGSWGDDGQVEVGL
jgi:hypothetical protein